ncbi:hypothetical protein J3458_017300 [Metarhizium acridum]|uniref:uncharacterized protein n=1 Tax=Metarhizium acridum TaxID=92637 RepID=UPI001C6CFF39|nr:hypothetical protein J3458_017300 [Metarhizium acridum]
MMAYIDWDTAEDRRDEEEVKWRIGRDAKEASRRGTRQVWQRLSGSTTAATAAAETTFEPILFAAAIMAPAAREAASGQFHAAASRIEPGLTAAVQALEDHTEAAVVYVEKG